MKILRLTMLISIVFFSGNLFQSCDSTSDPVPEVLSSFDISAPDTVTTGVPFTVTVTAVGDQGTKPFSSFNGNVGLTVSEGNISPGTLALSSGRGTLETVLSGVGGAQTLTASSEGASGSIMLNAGLLDAIPGDPGDPVAGAIPEFDYVPTEDNFSAGHPDLNGAYISHNIVFVVFELGTTIGEANALIAAQGASIVGGLTGLPGQSPGILFLQLPLITHEEMETALTDLNADVNVSLAVQDILLEIQEIPGENAGNTALWAWETVPTGGNWGLELCRVPQMWNLNGSIRKSGRAVMTGIVDAGFYLDHEDLIFYNLTPLAQHDHGIMVAGIIAATYDNDKGIDGVNPFAGLTVKGLPHLSGISEITARISSGQAFISEMYSLCKTYTSIKVLNMSLGYNWYLAGVDPANSAAARTLADTHGRLMKYTLDLLSFRRPLPVICVSAGNESNHGFGVQDAVYNSPMTNAALTHGVENIIVVEAVENSPGTGEGGANLWEHSCINGHISAPGADIQTTIVGHYGTGNGTSLSSPFVAGLVGYLLCVDPDLSINDIRNLLMTNAIPVGGGGQPRVDTWASVMDIDRINGNTDVLMMICDIDDGTEDGNKRVNFDTGDDYTEEDFDEDGGIGDGRVDMSDFRRWRDWLAQVDGHELNGSEDNIKKDINGDKVIGTNEEENVYPRGDFNGDGKIHATEASFVPGSINDEATDLEIFKAVFSDDYYEAVDLDDLVHSFDLEVDASRFFSSSAPSPHFLLQVREAISGTVLHERDYHASDSKFLVTVPYVESGYNVSLELSNTSLRQDYGDVTFQIGISQDVLIDVIASMRIDPRATYLHVCEDMAHDASPIYLASLGIEPGDVLLLESSGNIVMGRDSYGDRIGAVFSSSSTLLSGSAIHRVPGAIHAGAPFVSEVTSRCDGESTDIPEDFTVNDIALITVPEGARYLFVAKHDTWYEDNSDPEDDWRFVIAVIKGYDPAEVDPD